MSPDHCSDHDYGAASSTLGVTFLAAIIEQSGHQAIAETVGDLIILHRHEKLTIRRGLSGGDHPDGNLAASAPTLVSRFPCTNSCPRVS